MRNFATQLTAYVSRGNSPSETNAAAAFHVCEALHGHMAIFVGNSAFRAFLAHALALTKAEAPWLGEMRLQADGTLEGLKELQAQLDPQKLSEGGIVLLAQLLGLLVAFIGERLTLRMVNEVWPKFALKDLDSWNENRNDQRKRK
jgi:hypothetical protein